jgi:hypothetical protein
VQLEFIPDGALDTPLVRLYDFDEAHAARLYRVVAELESGARDAVRLHELPAAESIDGCQLTLNVGNRDEGVRGEPPIFSCVLTRETWGQVADLIEPFCEQARPGTFQYLDDTSAITLLLSVDGGW